MSARLPPSCPDRGDKARGAAIRLGATPLEALIVGQVAAYGSVCWLKDWQIADEIVQRNKRHPHPRSVARARRSAARQGLMTSVRLGPGARIPGKRAPVTYGTTAKVVVFDKRFGVPDPLRRGDRRRLRHALHALNEEIPLPTPLRGHPRYSAPPVPPSTPPRPELDPRVKALADEIAANMAANRDRADAAEDRRTMDAVLTGRKAHQRGPPGQS